MPPCCLATGRWGAARRRLDTGIARDPAPCPLPPACSYEESTGWHDENKVIITETPNVTMSWTRMIGHCCTVISLKRVHCCNGHFHFWTKKQCKKWFGPRVGLVLSRVHKLSYAKKKFFCSLNFFCEKFPIKHCSTHNMWIHGFFRSISSSYFQFVYLNICASAIDNLSLRLNSNVVKAKIVRLRSRTWHCILKSSQTNGNNVNS